MAVSEARIEAELASGGGISACPACVAAPSAEAIARAAAEAKGDTRLILSIPAAHCAACITTVEHAAEAVPGVRSARVNLTLKRVSIEADPEVTPARLIEAIAGRGLRGA